MKFLLSKRGSLSVCLLCFLISLVLVGFFFAFSPTFLIFDLICLILTPSFVPPCSVSFIFYRSFLQRTREEKVMGNM